MGSQHLRQCWRFIDVVWWLDFVPEILVIEDQPVAGRSLFEELVEDSWDGKSQFYA
jgi:hypothetical protein